MEGRVEFLNKLNGLVSVAKAQGNQIAIDEVKSYFTDTDLTEEQLELVFDYLLAQKVVVKGYWKQEEKETFEFTEEEKEFLRVKRTLEDFKVGLCVPGKLMPKRIKGGTLLVETTYEMR